MSRFMWDIRQAIQEGRLTQPFRGADVERACPGWGTGTYRVFLAKHRVGNPVRIHRVFHSGGARTL